MARSQFQDIVPPDKKSIRKIPVPERRGNSAPVPPPPQKRVVRDTVAPAPLRVRREEPEEETILYEKPPVIQPEPEAPVRRSRAKKKRSWPKVIVVLILLALVGGGIYLSTPQFSGAKITVTPRAQVVSVDSQFNAKKDATDGLQYQTVTIAKEGKLVVAGTTDEYVDLKASGTIIIYNNYSEAEQKLIANTRFETPNGLIFRLNAPITVPGKKGSTPGSVEAVVTAEKSGPDYNVGLTDFTIPGFKGDPRYTAFYGRSKIAMQGGFTGTRKKVDDAEIKSARERVRNELQANLMSQASKGIPTGFVLPKNSYYIEYESLADATDPTGIQIAERATFHGIIFKTADLAQQIEQKLSGSGGSASDIPSVDTLAFSMKATSTKPWESPVITFSLKGTTTLVSTIDSEKLKNDLVNKPRKNLNAILASYPGIEKAEVTIRPFWKSVFPETTDKILITIANPALSS